MKRSSARSPSWERCHGCSGRRRATSPRRSCRRAGAARPQSGRRARPQLAAPSVQPACNRVGRPAPHRLDAAARYGLQPHGVQAAREGAEADQAAGALHQQNSDIDEALELPVRRVSAASPEG
jgi:hypothetical protein